VAYFTDFGFVGHRTVE